MSNNDVGTLPIGSQLSVILLSSALNYALQDQVSDLEFPRLDVLAVSRPNLLLIDRDADLGHLTPFFRVVQYQTE